MSGVTGLLIIVRRVPNVETYRILAKNGVNLILLNGKKSAYGKENIVVVVIVVEHLNKKLRLKHQLLITILCMIIITVQNRIIMPVNMIILVYMHFVYLIGH